MFSLRDLVNLISPKNWPKTTKIIQKVPKFLRRIILGIAIFFALYTILGFFVLPPVLKSVLTKKLSENLNRKASIEKIELNPYVLSLAVKGFHIKDRNSSENFVSFDNLYLNVQSLSLFKLALIIKEIRLERPYIHIVRKDAKGYNFSDLIGKEEKPSEGPPSEPFRFSLNNVQISNARLDFSDIPKDKKHRITDMNITVPFISNFPYYAKIFVQPSFEAKINDKPVSFQGKTRPFAESVETYFDVNIQDINLPYYLSYLPLERNFELVSGYLDTKLMISYSIKKDKKPVLNIAGNIALRKLVVEDAEKVTLLNLPRLDISVTSAKPLAKDVHLAKVLLHAPEIDIRRDKEGRVNVQGLFPEEKGKTTDAESSKGGAFSLDIDEIRLTGGKVLFSDFLFSEPFKTSLDPLDLVVSHFGTAAAKKATYELSFRTDSGEMLDLAGEFSLSPIFAKGKMDLKAVPLKKYFPYYKDQIAFDIKDSTLELHTNYIYAQSKEKPQIKLSDLKTSISNLKCKKSDEVKDFLSVPLFSLEGTNVDLVKGQIEIGKIYTEKGSLELNRTKESVLNLTTLLPSRPSSNEETTKDKKKEKAGDWDITIKEVLMDDYSVNFEDLKPPKTVMISMGRIKLNAKNISTKKDQKGTISVSFDLNKKGKFSTNGTISINPLVAHLKMDIKDIHVEPLQPYFTEDIKIIVTNGRVSLAGDISAVHSDEKGLQGAFKGAVSLDDLSTVDALNKSDLIYWESLNVKGINLGYNPTFVNIDEVALADFYSKIIVSGDGSLNIQKIFPDEGTKKQPAPSPLKKDKDTVKKGREKQKQAIKIGKVTLQHGHIVFLDKSIKPNYMTSLFDMGGEISPVILEKGKEIDVALRAKLDRHGPLEITGKLKPLDAELYADLQVTLKALDLSPFSPYSGKYLGCNIEKGKLYLNLKYHIEANKLTAGNKIFLDQLTLGDTVESPDATDLPVGFAIALLKNNKGEIDLDLPVTGSIDDPEFSLGGIILKVITNLITKAAASPFALIGAIVGGGEELSYVEFDYGRHDITPGNSKKLDSLVKVLAERTALKLEIEGHLDTEKDREGLRRYKFDRAIKTQKLRAMKKKGQPLVPVDAIEIEDDEYEKYLKMAYKAGKFSKPKTRLGLTKKLPRGEMEKLLLGSIRITDDDLRLLLYNRVKKVRAHILASKDIDPGRIFVIEPKSLLAEKKENVKSSRVDFKLK